MSSVKCSEIIYMAESPRVPTQWLSTLGKAVPKEKPIGVSDGYIGSDSVLFNSVI